jgi:hypothetical protein
MCVEGGMGCENVCHEKKQKKNAVVKEQDHQDQSTQKSYVFKLAERRGNIYYEYV